MHCRFANTQHILTTVTTQGQNITTNKSQALVGNMFKEDCSGEAKQLNDGMLFSNKSNVIEPVVILKTIFFGKY